MSGETHAREWDDWRGRLELLVLQPTPFCNLDCSYCYLPNRSDTSRMSMQTLEHTVRAVARGGWAGPKLSVIWHAGEPLVVGPEWYEEAFAVVRGIMPPDVEVQHHFQTNAVLVNPAWCSFIARHGVKIGVSVDGPAFLHDARRKTRDGKGTHAKVERGIALLRAAGIPFHTIGVLTRASLAHPDEIFDYFATLGARRVGFNVEEVEADNATSSLMNASVEAEYRTFWRRMLERHREALEPFPIREVERVVGALASPLFGRLRGTQENEPGRIVSVGWDGAFSTWSPEMLGGAHARLGSLSLGTSLEAGLTDDARRRLVVVQEEITAGIAACERTCKYFDFCLGGVPSNKLGEHGRFDVTETMFCRLHEQAVTDVVLEALDAELPPESASRAY